MQAEIIHDFTNLIGSEDYDDLALADASETLFPKLSDYLNGCDYIADGAMLIAKERREQIEKHGRTIKNDRKTNSEGQLSFGAALLCCKEPYKFYDPTRDYGKPKGWNKQIWVRMVSKTYKERLIIAGALIAAEIDRIQLPDTND